MDGIGVWEPAVAADLNLGVGVVRYLSPTGKRRTSAQINISTLGIMNIVEWEPGTIIPGTPAILVVPMAGAVPGDKVLASLTPSADGIIIDGRCDSIDVVRVVAHNVSAGNITLGIGTLRVVNLPLPQALSSVHRPGA